MITGDQTTREWLRARRETLLQELADVELALAALGVNVSSVTVKVPSPPPEWGSQARLVLEAIPFERAISLKEIYDAIPSISPSSVSAVLSYLVRRKKLVERTGLANYRRLTDGPAVATGAATDEEIARAVALDPSIPESTEQGESDAEVANAEPQ